MSTCIFNPMYLDVSIYLFMALITTAKFIKK